MVKGNLHLLGILSDPNASAAFFASVLRNFLASRNKSEVISAIASVTWKEGTITIKTSNRPAAFELGLFRTEITEACSHAIKNIGYSQDIRVVIR